MGNFSKFIKQLEAITRTRFELQQSFEPEHSIAVERWVKLEDIKQMLAKIQENYVLVKIGDLETVIYTSTFYENLRDIVNDFYGNYDDVAREAYSLGMKDLAKRLLQNE